MNEKNKSTLLSWVYKVDNGFVLNSSGKHVCSISKNGITINSIISKDLYQTAEAAGRKR